MAEKPRFGEKAPGIFNPAKLTGMKRAKYEQMLEERRDELEKMSLADVSEYLEALRERYQERLGVLLEQNMRALGADLHNGGSCPNWEDLYDQAMATSREQAFKEFMEA